jgi:uncharacterized protein
MKYNIKVKTRAKQEKIEKIDKNNFLVSVKEPATENRANEAVIKVLADFLGVSKSRIEIIKGLKSRNKVISINLQAPKTK